MFGEFISILEFLNSFQDILAVKVHIYLRELSSTDDFVRMNAHFFMKRFGVLFVEMYKSSL